MNHKSFDLHLVRDAQMDTLIARAKVRQLEKLCGEATDADGEYWLARTKALEHVAACALTVLHDPKGGMRELGHALERLSSVKAPVCRVGDHACSPD